MHETNNSYVNTKEHRNYLELHDNWGKFKEELQPVLESIKDNIVVSGIIVNGTANNTPCYEIELLLESTKEAKSVIVIFISMFIPFYHIVSLKANKSNNQLISSVVIPKEIEVKISGIMKEKLQYHKFPNNLLDCQIPNLEVYSDFSYTTAFFADGYRIAHL